MTVTKALVEYRDRHDNYTSKLDMLEGNRARLLEELDSINNEIKQVKDKRIEDQSKDEHEEHVHIENIKGILGRDDEQ